VWVLRLSAMIITARPRASERATAARPCATSDISGPSCGNPAIKPPVSPIHQSKAVDLLVITWCFYQTLTAPPFQAPDPGERRVKGKLHFVLQVEIGSREQRQEFRHIGGKLTPQISFNQVFNG
jgi:hypothetical protein